MRRAPARPVRELLHCCCLRIWPTAAFTQQVFTHRSFWTQRLLHTQTFTHSKLLHREAFTKRSLYRQKLLHAEAFASFYAQSFYTGAFPHTANIFHTASFCTEKLVQKFLHREVFTQKSFCTQNRLHREAFTYTMATEIAAPNRSSAPKRKKEDLEALFNRPGILKGKQSAPILRKTAVSHQRNLEQPLKYDLRCPVAQ